MRTHTHTHTHTQTDTHTHTHRQTHICLEKIYVEGPVQNNKKTKIEKSIWILSVKITGPLHPYRTQDYI